MRLIHLVLILFILCCNYGFSQIVSIDNSIPLTELIENYLADGCVEISNVNSSINGSADGFPSFGAFQRADSNFPLSNGIIISTGKLKKRNIVHRQHFLAFEKLFSWNFFKGANDSEIFEEF